MVLVRYALLLAAAALARGSNSSLDDACAGPWGTLLEDWATAPSVPSGRHGRIMALPPANGYYVTERIDGPLVSPLVPPPRPPPVPLAYSEWEGSAPPHAGKIVNRPPAPYKDKFKPSYAPPSPPRPAADRVDAPPGKLVSETDLYLLGAIEKLVYRVDLLEKRLRRTEESVHYLVAGADAKQEPCAGNFSRVGGGCYQWARAAADWKGASAACRRQRAALLELREPAQRRALTARLLTDDDLRGAEFWTGGLNPGLLWIWSGSARPVEAETANTTLTVPGSGRCLSFAHEPATRTYAYRGRDCSATLRYICQQVEDEARLAEDTSKAARSLRLDARRAKLLWSERPDGDVTGAQ